MINLYGKIEPELSETIHPLTKRIILFDPAEAYSRIKINTKKRWQSISIDRIFPDLKNGICGCGCGDELTGRRTRWASEDCSDFAVGVQAIIQGKSQYIRILVQKFLPFNCAKCGKEEYTVEKQQIAPWNDLPYTSFMASGIHLDHIVEIEDGGGGCWLGNYQFLCHVCNNQKASNARYVRRNKQPSMPINYNF